MDQMTKMYMDEETPEAYYEAALLHEPAHDQKVYAHTKLSECAAENGQWEEAARHARIGGDWRTALKRAMELNPEHWYLAELDSVWEGL